jgi:hypothetical protein
MGLVCLVQGQRQESPLQGTDRGRHPPRYALGGFVDVVVPFKRDAVSVREVKHVGICVGVTEALDFCDDRIGHRHHRDLAPLDLLTGAEVKYFVGSLYVSCQAEDDPRSRARDHPVQGGGFVMGFAVGTKACLAVSLEIELLPEDDFPGREPAQTRCLQGLCRLRTRLVSIRP